MSTSAAAVAVIWALAGVVTFGGASGVALGGSPTREPSPSAKPPMFDRITADERDAKQGCVFSEHSGQGDAVFFADEGSHARARVSGKSVRMDLESSDGMRARHKGDAFAYKYVLGTLSVTYEGKRVNECPIERPSETLCEASHGKITFKQMARRESKDVIEWCGLFR